MEKLSVRGVKDATEGKPQAAEVSPELGKSMKSLLEIATAPSNSAEPGTLFGYQIIEAIGQGAGSQIYAVSDPDTRQIFALKHVKRQSDRDIRFVDQLETEYHVGRQVTHPGLRR